VFASPDWLEGCVSMLSAFLETIDECRDNPEERLPEVAPPVVDQVAAVVERARDRQQGLRESAQARGPEFRTSELGAVLWWAGMALHKATEAIPAARRKMAQGARFEAFVEVHSLLYDTISGLSLLSVAEGLIHDMEMAGREHERPN